MKSKDLTKKLIEIKTKELKGELNGVQVGKELDKLHTPHPPYSKERHELTKWLNECYDMRHEYDSLIIEVKK